MLLFGLHRDFVGVGLVYKEIERRDCNVKTDWPRAVPVGSTGLSVTLLVNVLVMGIGVTRAGLCAPGWDPLAGRVWPAILLIYVELLIITGVALLFSSFSSPALSALLTFFVFIIGHFSSDLKALAESSVSLPARWLFRGLYYGLPNLSRYSVITATAHGLPADVAGSLAAAAYALVYVALLLSAATLIFRRRSAKLNQRTGPG
jgi:ABC-type transport system involved in multi-copper enzyme maturation permease subunit